MLCFHTPKKQFFLGFLFPIKWKNYSNRRKKANDKKFEETRQLLFRIRQKCHTQRKSGPWNFRLHIIWIHLKHSFAVLSIDLCYFSFYSVLTTTLLMNNTDVLRHWYKGFLLPNQWMALIVQFFNQKKMRFFLHSIWLARLHRLFLWFSSFIRICLSSDFSQCHKIQLYKIDAFHLSIASEHLIPQIVAAAFSCSEITKVPRSNLIT